MMELSLFVYRGYRSLKWGSYHYLFTEDTGRWNEGAIIVCLQKIQVVEMRELSLFVSYHFLFTEDSGRWNEGAIIVCVQKIWIVEMRALSLFVYRRFRSLKWGSCHCLLTIIFCLQKIQVVEMRELSVGQQQGIVTMELNCGDKLLMVSRHNSHLSTSTLGIVLARIITCQCCLSSVISVVLSYHAITSSFTCSRYISCLDSPFLTLILRYLRYRKSSWPLLSE